MLINERDYLVVQQHGSRPVKEALLHHSTGAALAHQPDLWTGQVEAGAHRRNPRLNKLAPDFPRRLA
jgi:hypothetical protein